MPIPGLEKSCPKCIGNLHFEETQPHPHRFGYDIHTYKCLECGPIVYITQLSDDAYVTRWDPASLNKGNIGEPSAC